MQELLNDASDVQFQFELPAPIYRDLNLLRLRAPPLRGTPLLLLGCLTFLLCSYQLNHPSVLRPDQWNHPAVFDDYPHPWRVPCGQADRSSAIPWVVGAAYTAQVRIPFPTLHFLPFVAHAVHYASFIFRTSILGCHPALHWQPRSRLPPGSDQGRLCQICLLQRAQSILRLAPKL